MTEAAVSIKPRSRYGRNGIHEHANDGNGNGSAHDGRPRCSTQNRLNGSAFQRMPETRSVAPRYAYDAKSHVAC